MNKKLKYTHEEYVEKLKSINPKIEVLEKYTGARKKILHKCSCGKHWLVAPYSLLSGNTKSCGLCITFADYLLNTFGEIGIDKYWSKENTLNPWKISYQSNKSKVKILCQEKDYHGSYEISCANFVHGRRCGYCNPNSGKCHPKDSIAQFIIDKYGIGSLEKHWSFKRNSINPWETPKSSEKRAYFKCVSVEYHDDYNIRIVDFYHGTGICSQCGNKKVHILDSIGSIYPISIELWSDKNKKSPYEYSKKSGKKVFWKCENEKHKDYARIICDASLFNFRCPECVKEKEKSSYQEAVENYIIDKYNYKVLHEFNCTLKPTNPKTKRRLRYDNEIHIGDKKLIIEVNGRQHYDKGGWNTTSAKSKNNSPEEELEYQKWKDKYKKEFALANNAYYLELPYWEFDNDNYKSLIDKAIRDIEDLKKEVS